MKTKVLLSVASMLALASMAAGQDATKPTKTPTDKRPYLLFTTAELATIKAETDKITSANAKASFKRKLRRAKGDAAFLAFGGLWNGDAKMLAAAKAVLLKQAEKPLGERYTVHTGGAVRRFVYAYDWLYNDLSGAERAKCRDFIRRQITQGMGGWKGRAGRRGGNWEASIFGSFVVAGLAMINDEPKAAEWIAVGMKGLTRGYLTMSIGPGGAAYEPFIRYHLNVSFYSMLPAMEAYRRVTGKDPFGANDRMLQRHMAYYAYMLYPDRKGMCNFGDGRTGLFPIFPYVVKTAAEYSDGLAAWYLKTHLADGLIPNNWGMVFYLLWIGEAATVESTDPDTSDRLPLARAYTDGPGAKGGLPASGSIFMRTGFGRKDDIQFAMPGNLASQHGHGDKGSYIFNALGETFLQDPYLHQGSYRSPSATFFRSDASHNLVLVDGAGPTYIRGGGLWDRNFGKPLATVEAFSHSKTTDYARVNLKRGYGMNPKNKGIRRAVRHVVFLRGKRPDGAMVIIDDFQKDDATHTYSHNFHPGADVKVAPGEGGRIVLKGKSASCLVSVLHPDGVDIKPAEQFKSKYLAVTIGKPMKRLVLVTVLQPTTGDATRLTATRTDDAKTVTVRVGDRTVVFDKASTTVTVDGQSPVTSNK